MSTENPNYSEAIDDLQTQIYIIAGVFGGISLLLLSFIIVLLAQVFRMSKKVRLGIDRSEGLSKHGFTAYTGRPQFPQDSRLSTASIGGYSSHHSAYENNGFDRPSGVRVLPSIPNPSKRGNLHDFY